jgi:hypothetical protein
MVGGDVVYHSVKVNLMPKKKICGYVNMKISNIYMQRNCFSSKNLIVVLSRAIVNQHPPMHQLAVLSMGWAAFFGAGFASTLTFILLSHLVTLLI